MIQCIAKPLLFVGIDPGTTGALAQINPTETSVGDLSRIDLYTLITSMKYHYRVLVAVEDVHAFQKAGANSSFTFGKSIGELHAILKLSNVPWELVPPKVWQKGMFFGKKKDPETARLQAIAKWPHLKDQLCRKKDHNRADALWIAEYLRRIEIST